MAYDEALAALADPTRRAMLERLRRREHPVGELARALRISQPAASQHLRVLAAARLVEGRREGTRHLFRARPDGLAELRAWVDGLWDDVLTSYAAGGKKPKERPWNPKRRGEPR